MASAETRTLIAALTDEGATVRFVGGCVRDAVLAQPAGDIDLASDADPETNLRLLKKAGIRAVPTGLKHGTVTAVFPVRHFEITTLRVDVLSHGRHATVAFTDDWVADAARRDFTINAIYADLDGTLYDPFGGIADARAGRVRFVGDPRARIEEDRLRLLRFFRFHGRFGRVAPDPETLSACRDHAPRIGDLSGERVRDEVLKIMAGPDPADVVALMVDEGIMPHVLPAATNAPRLAALEDAEAHWGDASALRRLAAVLKTDRDGALAIAGRLRLSNKDRLRLADMVDPPPSFRPPGDGPRLDKTAQLAALYRLGLALYVDLVLLDWATDMASGADTTRRSGAHRAALDLARTAPPLHFPLKGQDVIDAGMGPGPRVAEILADIEAWWIAGGLTASRAACLARLKETLAAG